VKPFAYINKMPHHHPHHIMDTIRTLLYFFYHLMRVVKDDSSAQSMYICDVSARSGGWGIQQHGGISEEAGKWGCIAAAAG
jgi:hypothetical protein